MQQSKLTKLMSKENSDISSNTSLALINEGWHNTFWDLIIYLLWQHPIEIFSSQQIFSRGHKNEYYFKHEDQETGYE